MFRQLNMSGDPKKGDVGVDQLAGEEGEINSLCKRVCGIGVSEGVK